MMATLDIHHDLCRACGHPIDWHHHHRSGTDCSRCACQHAVTDDLGGCLGIMVATVITGVAAVASVAIWWWL